MTAEPSSDTSTQASTKASTEAVTDGRGKEVSVDLDCAEIGARGVNAVLRVLPDGAVAYVRNPAGAHNLAVGLTRAMTVHVDGPSGYYLGGLGARASVRARGYAGQGLGENLMSGLVAVDGDAAGAVGASAHGGLVAVAGDCSPRAAISLKGGTVAVAGSIGPFGAFLAQAGTLLVGGDAGEHLGDSLYETVIYVGGRIAGLGTDAVVEELTAADVDTVRDLVARTGFTHIDPENVTRVASARTLYHFSTHRHDAY